MPTPVAMIHATGEGPVRRMPSHWANPRMVPVIAPPATAGPRLSTGPTISAAKPPAGKPRKVGIQRSAIFGQLRDAVTVVVVVVGVHLVMGGGVGIGAAQTDASSGSGCGSTGAGVAAWLPSMSRWG